MQSQQSSQYRVKIASYVIGSLALVSTIAAVLMLVFIRDDSIVIVSTSPSTSAPYVPPPLQPEPTLAKTTAPTQTLTFTDFTSKLNPVTSVGENVPNVSISTPEFAPGAVPFSDTLALPLQAPPQGYGHCAILPNAQQFFSSLSNGYAAFGQYNYATTQSEKKFIADTNSYKQRENIILFNCPTTGKQPDINVDASAVGSVGFGSIAVSDDGLRLYVAYKQPYMGSSITSQLFPFQQLIGRVGVYTRPVTNSTGQSDSSTWSYSCDLSLRNPFGSQAGGLVNFCNPSSREILTGDDFGSLIRTSIDQVTGDRLTAVRANFGYVQSNGACISVFTEQSTGSQTVSGVLQLWDFYPKDTVQENIVFGQDFDLGNDALVAAIRVPANGCADVAYTPVNKLAYFLYNYTLSTWEFKQTIDTPDTKEDFGVSVRVSPDGNMMLVGAPTFPAGYGYIGSTPYAPGQGGSMYVYKRATDKTKWTLHQTVKDPFALTHSAGAFGYSVSTDPAFLVAAVSANQNNTLGVKPPLVSTVNANTELPVVLLFPIDQKEVTVQVNPVKVVAITQPAPTPTQNYVDPLFGSNVAMAFPDALGTNSLRVCANSPMNQLVDIYDL